MASLPWWQIIAVPIVEGRRMNDYSHELSQVHYRYVRPIRLLK